LKLRYVSTKPRGVTLRTTVLFIIIPVGIEKPHRFIRFVTNQSDISGVLKKAGYCIQFEPSFALKPWLKFRWK
jgi:hypothetical protein